MQAHNENCVRARRFASSAILALAICLVVPSFLFLNNTHSIDLSFGHLLFHAAVFSATLAGVLYLILSLAGRWRLSFLVAGLGLFIALKFLFLPTYVPLLDGTETFATLWTTEGKLSIVLCFVTLIGCILAAGFLRTDALAMIVLVLLLVGLQPLLQSEHRNFSLPALSVEKSDVVKFSSTGDTLVVVIDTTQSDVALEVLQDNPDLAANWVGFDYFWNNTGKAPTTLMSMLAIYSGKEYSGGSITARYKALASDSIFSDARDAGYRLDFAGISFFGCFIENCVSSASLERLSPYVTSLSQYARSIDIGFLRVLPLPLHAWWHDSGRGRIEPLVTHRATGVAEESAAQLRGLARDLEVVSGEPGLKVVHVLGAHHPIVLDANCSRLPKMSATRNNYKAFVECSIRRFTDVLKALHKAGIYDQTTIVVMADHGTTIRSAGGQGKIFERALTYADRRGQFAPMLAIKPKNARHPFRLNDALSENADLRATLCAKVFGCKREVPGTDVFKLSGENRLRSFVDFRMHQSEHRKLDYMPDEVYRRFEGTGTLREFDYDPKLVKPRSEYSKGWK